MAYLGKLLTGVFLPALLLSSGLFWLFYLKGEPFFRLIPNLKALKDQKKGGKSPLKSVAVALAGTLGVGNMVGVAAALKEGGAGVLFWMWISSIAAMVVKYVEICLCMRHRVADKSGFSGGAMYYMPRPVGLLFALLCLVCAFSVGGAMQSGAFCAALLPEKLFSSNDLPSLALSLLCGFLLFLPLCAAFFQKSNRLFDLTAWLVPFLSLIFTALCLGVLFCHRHALPDAFLQIFKQAFCKKSVLLGSGSALLTAIRLGVVRGILSNEAGCGTAPMAHGASSARNSRAQGALGMIEVAFDTLFLCSLTGLTLLVCPESLQAKSGIDALLFALSSVFGKAARPLLAICLYFFALR